MKRLAFLFVALLIAAPALATPIDKVPNGERWIHEIKFGGYRVQLEIANESASVFTTRRFKKIADDAFLINASSADHFFKCPTCSPMALRMVRLLQREA